MGRVMVKQLDFIGGIEGNPTTRKITAIKMKIVFMHQMERENGKIFVVRKNTPMYVKNLPHIVLMRSIAYQKRKNDHCRDHHKSTKARNCSTENSYGLPKEKIRVPSHVSYRAKSSFGCC